MKNLHPAPLVRTRPAAAGFTLVEIMVVVLIIGILSVGAVLSLGVVGEDRQLDRERDRILTITEYLRDQAALQNREFGMRMFTGGYEFLALDPRTSQWEQVTEDPMLRARTLPPGIQPRLLVEGRPIVLPKRDEKDPSPQIMLLSSGELNSFELTLRREDDGEVVVLIPSPQESAIIERKPEDATS